MPIFNAVLFLNLCPDKAYFYGRKGIEYYHGLSAINYLLQ